MEETRFMRICRIDWSKRFENEKCSNSPIRFDERKRPHNCVNCGAALNSDECDYCGTKY